MHLSENDIRILIKESDKSLRPIIIVHTNAIEAGTLKDIGTLNLNVHQNPPEGL